MKPAGTLLLTRRDVGQLLNIAESIASVEHVFQLCGEGKTQRPGILGVSGADGGFHIKAGLLDLQRCYFAAKINANFPENGRRFGLPTIQGVIVLCDGEHGYPLAVMDSIEITIQRTGAATAVAAKHLARPDSKSILICGCGNQGRVSARALDSLFALERMFAYDLNLGVAEKFANEIGNELSLPVQAVAELAPMVDQIDIWVTCTPAKQFFLKRQYVAPGALVAAVGADSEDKQELDPWLLKGNKVVVDLLGQCAAIGELHHALEQEIITQNEVHAELAGVVAGTKPGRTSSEEMIIFDSTGMALQDVIMSAAVYEQAVSKGLGTLINFDS